MSKKRTNGLEAIFGKDLKNAFAEIENFQEENKDKAKEVRIADVKPNPYQPRKVFNEDKLAELAHSIKEHGVFTPILVKKDVKGYVLIAGERRLKASKLAGKKDIPAIVVDFNDKQMEEVALIENIQREDLNAIEEAQAYEAMMKSQKLTQNDLAQKIGKSRSHVANIVRLLDLPKKVQNYVLEGKVSAGHAKAVAALDDKDLMVQIIERAIKEELNVRKVEAIVAGYSLSKHKKPTIKMEKDKNFMYVEGLLRKRLGTKIEVSQKEIKIKYTSSKDLNRILELLGVVE